MVPPEDAPPYPVPFRTIEHTADTGFEVSGASLKELFENAARVLFQLIWESKETDFPERVEEISVTAGDLGELMVNFLEEFLYLYDAKGLVCTDIRIESVSETALKAEAQGHRFEEDKDQERLGVKAITYHQLFVGRANHGWKARVLLDI